WTKGELEAAIVEAGGCAAEFRSAADWAQHPQGLALAGEPVVHWDTIGSVSPSRLTPHADRPLSGLRVLDLTRIVAGPRAQRFLAGYGAEVLRIDPPIWDEPGMAPVVTVGKRCARLDLKSEADRLRFKGLLAEADVLVHGYRPGALDRLGLGAEVRRRI